MKIILNNEQTKNKELCYEEGFWTGKRTIKYNGVELTKVKHNLFEYNDGQTTHQFTIKGNQIWGVTINMFGQDVEITRKLKWYEYVLTALVLAPCCLFGAVGGAIGGGLGFTNLTIIRKIDKWWLKLVVSIEFMAIGLLLSYILAVIILKLTFWFM